MIDFVILMSTKLVYSEFMRQLCKKALCTITFENDEIIKIHQLKDFKKLVPPHIP